MGFLLNRGSKVVKSFIFMVLMKRAGSFFERPEETKSTLHKAAEKMENTVFDDDPTENLNARQLVGNFIRMVRAYFNGNYRGVSQKAVLVSLASLLYFIMPIDLMPDVIPVTGYIDDIGLLMWVMATYKDEIRQFLDWEKKDYEREDEIEILYEEVTD